MDGSRVMDQTMDSLWFFGNVFSSSSTILGPIKHVHEPVEEEWSKPMSATVQNQQIEPPKLPIEAEISIPVCPKFDEPESLKLEWEKVAVEVEYYNSPSPSPEKERGRRRSRRRSRRGLQRQRRKILEELDVMDFDDHVKEMVSWGWSSNWMAGIEGGNCGYDQRFGDQQQQMNTMPSISDDMAMKEHLKSWAYAVACTVR